MDIHAFFSIIPISDVQIYLSLFANLTVSLIKRHSVKLNLFKILLKISLKYGAIHSIRQVTGTFGFSHWKLLGNGTVTKHTVNSSVFMEHETNEEFDSKDSSTQQISVFIVSSFVIKDIIEDWLTGSLTEADSFSFSFWDDLSWIFDWLLTGPFNKCFLPIAWMSKADFHKPATNCCHSQCTRSSLFIIWTSFIQSLYSLFVTFIERSCFCDNIFKVTFWFSLITFSWHFYYSEKSKEHFISQSNLHCDSNNCTSKLENYRL